MRINPKYTLQVSVIALASIMFLACGGSPEPTDDIEATIEAAVQATAKAAPAPTPIPPSPPTPTALPTEVPTRAPPIAPPTSTPTATISPSATPLPTPALGNWIIDDSSIDPLDDLPSGLAFVLANDGVGLYGDPVEFTIWCKGVPEQNLTPLAGVFVSWYSYLGLDEAIVASRIGDQIAQKQMWKISPDGTATYAPLDNTQDLSAFLIELLDADRFVAQVTPYSANPITAVFDLTGIRNAMNRIMEHCS